MALYIGDNRYKPMVNNGKATFRTDNTLPYDYEVDWIGTTGNVYFETEFVPNTHDLTFEGKMYYAGYTTSSQWLAWFTAYTNENSSTYRIIRNSTSNTAVLAYNGAKAGGGGKTFNVALNTIYTFEFTPSTLKMNTTSIANTHSGNTNTGKLKIFSAQFKGRVYYFKVYKGNELILDIIPVVKNGVGCLYNKVNGNFFMNKSTGTVTIGNRV